MSEPKNNPKSPVITGFNWAESLKKAEQEGTTLKTEAAPAKSGTLPKASIKGGSSKQKATSGAKSQLRLRVKV
jgi:hypothetical protein